MEEKSNNKESKNKKMALKNRTQTNAAKGKLQTKKSVATKNKVASENIAETTSRIEKASSKQKNQNCMLEKLERDRVDNILNQEQKGGKDKAAEEERVYESKVSSKSIELFINNNTDRSVSDIIFCNLISMAAILLAAFIPVVSLALPILVYFYFEVGVAGYLLKKELGENCRFEQIFIDLKKYVKIFCLAIVKIFATLFGLVLFVVPGVMAMLNFSFAPFILAEEKDLDVKGVLMLSKELVFGYRLQIFFFGLLAMVAIAAAASLMFLIVLIFDAFLVVPFYAYVISVVAAGVLAAIVLALPMIQIVITDYYILAKQTKVRSFSC